MIRTQFSSIPFYQGIQQRRNNSSIPGVRTWKADRIRERLRGSKKSRKKECWEEEILTGATWSWRILLQIFKLFKDPLGSHVKPTTSSIGNRSATITDYPGSILPHSSSLLASPPCSLPSSPLLQKEISPHLASHNKPPLPLPLPAYCGRALQEISQLHIWRHLIISMNFPFRKFSNLEGSYTYLLL